MRKIFMFAMAAGLAMGAASCAKNPSENPVNGGGNVDGVSQMKVSFALPAVPSSNTRATSGEADNETEDGQNLAALAAELNVKTVTVYIFGSNGAAAGVPETTAEGDAISETAAEYFTLDVADFDKTTDSGVDTYSLKAGEELDVIAMEGARIFVGVNVPADQRAFPNQAALMAAAGSIGVPTPMPNIKYDELDLSVATNSNMTMFTEAPVTANLVKYDAAANAGAGNAVQVEAEVGRVASKLVATAKAQPAKVNWTNTVELTYSLKGYGVYNEAVESYLAMHADGTTLSTLNDFDVSYGRQASANTVQVGPQYVYDNSGLVNLSNGYYIGENNSGKLTGLNTPLSLNGNTTYAMIGTQVAVNKTIDPVSFGVTLAADADDVDGDGDTAEMVVTATTGAPEWTGAGNTVSGNSATDGDLYIVVKGAETYIIAASRGTGAATDDDNAQKLVDWLTFRDRNDEYAPEAKFYHYPAAYVHYQVWLNKYATNDYAIGRNEFIHIDVNSVKAIDGVFTGYPGDPEDPEKPIDPTDESNDNNPDPQPEDEEVDPTAAKLDVVVNIEPWVYRHNLVDLSR